MKRFKRFFRNLTLLQSSFVCGSLLFSPLVSAFVERPYAPAEQNVDQVVKLVIYLKSPNPTDPNPVAAFCSGVLLSPWLVLTARSCVNLAAIQSIQVIAENNKVGTADLHSFQIVPVSTDSKGVLITENGSQKKLSLQDPGDVAFFKLNSPLRLEFLTAGLRLARSKNEISFLSQKGPCTAFGYGPQVIDQKGISLLKSAEANIAVRKLHGFTIVPANSILGRAGVQFETDILSHGGAQVTEGDLGGPVICRNESKESVIIGMVRSGLTLKLMTVKHELGDFPISVFELFTETIDWMNATEQKLIHD